MTRKGFVLHGHVARGAKPKRHLKVTSSMEENIRSHDLTFASMETMPFRITSALLTPPESFSIFFCVKMAKNNRGLLIYLQVRPRLPMSFVGIPWSKYWHCALSFVPSFAQR